MLQSTDFSINVVVNHLKDTLRRFFILELGNLQKELMCTLNTKS